MDYSKEICEVFGIKRNEAFRIKGLKGTFAFDEDFFLENIDTGKLTNIQPIITGLWEIVKEPPFTEKEIIIIKYLKINYLHWLARNIDKSLCGFYHEPVFGQPGRWFDNDSDIFYEGLRIPRADLFNFLEEPSKLNVDEYYNQIIEWEKSE